MEILDTENRTRDLSVDDRFRIVCDTDGRIAFCTREASDAGFLAGFAAADVIDPFHVSEFEDLLHMMSTGADISMLLPAAAFTGYALTHVRSSMLFSAPVAEICLYKNKNEYLAATSSKGEDIGKVFSHIESSIEDAVALIDDAINEDGTGETLMERMDRIRRRIEKLNSDKDFVKYHMRKYAGYSADPINVSALFDLINKLFSAKAEKPFFAEFVNYAEDIPVMCDTDNDCFSGIVLMSAAIASRLSQYRACRVSLIADGDSAVIKAVSRLHKGYSSCFRSCDFKRLYELIPSNPIELMILEHLAAVPGWNIDFECDGDGNFTLHAKLVCDIDPDRLKFRDGTAGAHDSVSRYLDYLDSVFLSDPQ